MLPPPSRRKEPEHSLALGLALGLALFILAMAALSAWISSFVA